MALKELGELDEIGLYVTGVIVQFIVCCAETIEYDLRYGEIALLLL